MYKPCRSRKCIWGHIPMHEIFAVFIFFFIPVLSRPSFTSMTPDKDQKKDKHFYFPLIQAPSPGDVHELHGKCFCACYLQALKKVPRAKKWHVLVPLDRFPWFNHYSIALVLLYNMNLEPSCCVKHFFWVLADSMHKSVHRGAHGRLQAMGLEQEESRRVAFSSGLCLES